MMSPNTSHKADNFKHFCQKRDAVLKGLPQRALVMGILNLTPDSFSDGGQFLNPDNGLKHALDMKQAGADLIDIGAESTRPGATAIDADTEWHRLAPVLSTIAASLPDTPLSVDTYKADVAAKALEAGAVIVNDVCGLQHEPAMADLVAERQAGIIIMHNGHKADDNLDIMADIEAFFDKSLSIASAAGIPKGHIILDPGIGFAKTYEQNFTILNQLARLSSFNLPLLIGLSRKRFIGRLLDCDESHRLIGTLTANLFALSRGANMVRVHDVAEHVQAITMLSALDKGHP